MELICRICLQDTERDQFRNINEKNTKSSSITLKQRLKICVPEIKLEVTNDPIICNICYDDLQQAYDFKKKCLQTEEKVKSHMKKMKYRTCFKISEIANSGKDIVDLTEEENRRRMAVGNGGATIEFVDLSSITGIRPGLNMQEKRKLIPLMDDSGNAIKRGRYDEVEEILPDSKPKTVMPVIGEVKSLASLSDSETILPIPLMKPQEDSNYSVTVDKPIILPARSTPNTANSNPGTSAKRKTIIVYDKEDCDDPPPYESSRNEADSERHNQEFLNEDEDTNISSGVNSDAGSNTSEFLPHSDNSNGVDGPHVCTVCGLQKPNIADLKLHHKTSHSRLMCFICDRVFKNLATLKKHNMIHENVKNFECTVCNRKFREKAVLKTHMSQHTGQRPFHCPHCNKTYVTRSNLKAHIKSYHKINISDVDLDKCMDAVPPPEGMMASGSMMDEQDEPVAAEAVFLPPLKTEDDIDDIPEDVPNFIDIEELQQYANPT